MTKIESVIDTALASHLGLQDHVAGVNRARAMLTRRIFEALARAGYRIVRDPTMAPLDSPRRAC